MRIHPVLNRFISLCFAITVFASTTLALDVESVSPTSPMENSVQAEQRFSKVEDISVNRVANNESTLTAPVTDPNFNVMRNKEMLNSQAIFIVVGLLLLASIVPYVTWLVLRPK